MTSISPGVGGTSDNPPIAASLDRVDLRESLCNDPRMGPITQVQLPEDMITRLRGIMLDIDPDILRADLLPAGAAEDPRLLLAKVVRPWLDRHPLLQAAEVRCSGRGLHVLVWLEPAVEFRSAGERRRWSGIVRAIQATLPADPNAPGITAVTRPVGSINGKNGAEVTRLHPGQTIHPKVVQDFFTILGSAPFRTILRILTGAEKTRPCVVCRAENRTLSALDKVGRCYSCGKVTLGRLFAAFMR